MNLNSARSLTPRAIIIAAAVFASIGQAQTIHPESEMWRQPFPNDSKADALFNSSMLSYALMPGDGVLGNSTSATGTGPDYFLIETMPLPPGIYRHRLVLSSPTPGHTATIRALNQIAVPAGVWPCSIGTAGTTDAIGQTQVLSGGDRIVQWYGFGKQEKIYFRVTGTTATTSDYTAVLETEEVTPEDIGEWQTGQITITTAPPGHNNDCDMIVYDADLNPVYGYSNDAASINGGHSQNANFPTFLRRDYGPGVHYLAISNYDLMNDQGSPCDDNRRTGLMLDFPNAVVNGSAAAPVHAHFRITDQWGSIQVNTTKLSAFEVRWLKFTVGEVATGACCMPDQSCQIATAATCIPPMGLYMGDGSDCFSAPCPAPGACCLANGTCSVMSAPACAATSGAVFQGSQTTCDACAPQPAGSWFVRAPAPDVRVGAGGGVIGNNFYLIGGAPANGIRNLLCWRFDIVNNQWSPIADLPHSGAPSPQQGGISNFQAAVIGTSIYVVGGYSGVASYGALNRLLRYDAELNYWEEVFSDPYPTTSFAAGLAGHDGKLYVFGGHTALNTPTAACYRYDPEAPPGTRWSPIASLDVPRTGMSAYAIGDKIYAVGGEATDQDRVDIYDTTTNTWMQGPSMTALRGGCALYDLGGKPYAVSGGWSTYNNTGEILDNGAWIAGPSVINGLRSMAFGGNSTWLVRSTGFDGVYRGYTETMRVDASIPCYPNCDQSTTPPVLNVDDFTCFINEFAAAQPLPHEQQIPHYANCDNSTTAPVLNVDDFTCFINAFAQGCP